MADTPDKPKIIIDEDWKSQVQAEKEAAKAGPATQQSTTAGSQTPDSVGGSDTPPDRQSVGSTPNADIPDVDMPPASLVFLCTTLATQAMIALGQVPNPITGKVELRLKQAKHYIDTLGMLEEKTTGNRTADETALFDDLLHQLRMAYVMLQSEPAQS
ncbi:MAG TPA: DUF1844 domain-containing protein [Pirellulales bacterium]|nr:DUF1844 domain-containing protein [Pirellulales bacterium]